jgi:hypothetical protein
MAQVLITGAAIFVGGLLAALAWAGWSRLVRRVTRRNLASALIGEIVAVVHAIESERIVESLETMEADASSEKSVKRLVLPHLTVYERNGDKLDLFNPPLPRKLAYFFDSLTTLSDELASIDDNARNASALSRGERVRYTSLDVHDMLESADDILVALRQLATPNNHAINLLHPHNHTARHGSHPHDLH